MSSDHLITRNNGDRLRAISGLEHARLQIDAARGLLENVNKIAPALRLQPIADACLTAMEAIRIKERLLPKPEKVSP